MVNERTVFKVSDTVTIDIWYVIGCLSDHARMISQTVPEITKGVVYRRTNYRMKSGRKE
jgi:hypothetical protein